MEKELQSEAVEMVKKEKLAWEIGAAFVTEKVYFRMRDLIRTLRKNYYGVFDVPTDTTTGRSKVWVPLTEWICETVVKNIDLDTKDIQFKAKNQKSIPFTSLVRSVVRNSLEYMGFGEKLDEAERQLAIDGTTVWATEQIDKKPYTCVVDLLNFYIDPTAHSISETGAVIERILLSKPEFDSLAKTHEWENAELSKGSTELNRTDGDRLTGSDSGETPFVELFRRRGWVPAKYLGETGDDMVPGEIICSNNDGTWLFHHTEKRKDNKNKGYEEAWYTRVPGRWYGRGAAEKVMMLQTWINMVVNIRITKSTVSQLGLFKIRQGSGITPQMISRLPVNGAVLVQNMQDIENMVMQEAGATSYKDEETIMNWARLVTSAFESVTGEQMPSQTATTSAISSRAANSSFELIKEGVGMFLTRWLKNQHMPILFSNLTLGEIHRYYPDDIAAYDAYQVNRIIYEQMEQVHNSGLGLDPNQVLMEQQRAIAKLQAQGETRTMTYDEALDITDYDVEIEITNEGFDKGVLSQNLITALQAAPEYHTQILEELWDIMGLKFNAQQQMPIQAPPAAVGTQNPAQQTTQANTGEAFGKAQALSQYASGR